MKQKRSSIALKILQFFVFTFLATVSLFWLSGCTTNALELAREKASAENSEYWKINYVISAIKQENDNISVCVELNDSGETGIPQLSTLTLPLSIITADRNAIEKLGLRPAACPFDDASCYWYPIKKAKRGCQPIAAETSSAGSITPVEKFIANNKDPNLRYRLTNNSNKNQQTTEKIYELSFETDKIETEMDSEKAIECIETGSKENSLMYWSTQIDSRSYRPIIITGVYEDNSTNLYYLLVPPAFVGDVVAVTAFIVAMAIVQCPHCFTAANH